jgi:hypothetical protein
MTTPTWIFEKNPDVTTRPVGADMVLLDLKTGIYYKVNEVGKDMWELIDGRSSLSDIVHKLSETYDVTEETLTEDLGALLDDLIREDLVRRVEST